MTTARFTCVACGQDRTVEEDLEESRCVSCGTKYAAPWSDPEVIRSPIPEAEFEAPDANGTPAPRREPVTDGGTQEETVTVPAGANVRITIEVLPD